MSHSSPSENPARHGEYYLQEDLATFLVEDKLFRVHRFLFRRESEFFKALFSLHPPPGHTEEGAGDDSPLTLPGVTIEEFEALLDHFYHGGSETRSPQEHWALLLSIATRYDFEQIREHAIQEISSLAPPVDPIRLVELAFRHDVSQWLERAKIGRCRAELIMADRDTSIARTPSGSGELAGKIVRKVFWPYGPSA